MFLSIVKVVLVPIALGFVVNHFFHAFTQNAVRVLPLVSTTAIVLIICAVVSANAAKIMTSGLLILVVVILHNLLGYLTGFGVGKPLKLDSTKCRAISIEVGMQNSGLANLAAAHFASIRWQPSPALCSPCGTTFPVPSRKLLCPHLCDIDNKKVAAFQAETLSLCRNCGMTDDYPSTLTVARSLFAFPSASSVICTKCSGLS